MRLLAVIVNFRSADFLHECLVALGAAGAETVAVIDNFSSEDERARVREAVSGVPVQVITSFLDDNLGFGYGVNRGVESLGAEDDDLVWIVNPDAVVTEHAARSMTQTFERNSADIVSPLILTGSREKPMIWFAGGEFKREIGRTQHLHINEEPGDLSGVQSVGFVTGAAPMMRARVFRQLNGFREDLFLYWEDADLSWRARQSGLRLAVDLDAHVWHAVGGSGDSVGKSAHYYRYMQRNRMVVAARWSSRWNLLLGRGAIETAKLTLRPLKERNDRMKKLRAGISGLVEGFRLA